MLQYSKRFLIAFALCMALPTVTLSKEEKNKRHDEQRSGHSKKKADDNRKGGSTFDSWKTRTGTGQEIKGSPYHNANQIDIDGNKGDPIKPFRKGKVIEAGPRRMEGNTVVVQDKKGNTYQYSHLDRIGVKKGDKVSRSQTIGTIGNTGRGVIPGPGRDGSHLHFEKKDKAGRSVRP